MKETSRLRRFMYGAGVGCACWLLLIATSLFGPGCSATARHTSLSMTTATLDAAQVGFVSFDGDHQLELVAACGGTKLDCQSTLVAYRARRTKVVTALVVAYQAVAAAWRLDNNVSVANAVAAGVAVEQAIKLIGETK